MKRFKNYGLLMSLTSQAVIVAQLGAALFFHYDITKEMQTQIVGLVDAVLILLSFAGIVSNPTTENKGFGDDK
jgi:uncharacterized membrane protein